MSNFTVIFHLNLTPQFPYDLLHLRVQLGILLHSGLVLQLEAIVGAAPA